MKSEGCSFPQRSVDEKLFALLVSSVKDYAIFMIDPYGFIMSWNPGAEHIKGYKEAEVVGKHISIFYVESDIKAGEPQYNLAQALKNGSHESEGWRMRKNGSLFWANIVFTPLYDEQHNHVGFAKITRDITQRKLTDDEKEALKKQLSNEVEVQTKRALYSERRFRQLIENSYDGISLLNENFDVIFRSKSAEKINGWSNEERVHQNMDSLIHPDDRHRVAELVPQILANPGKPYVVQFRSRKPGNEYIWLECLFSNMLNNEDIQAIVCNFRDISDRVKAEDDVRDKAKQIEDILERITDGFIALDKDLCYTYANKEIGRMVGIEPALLIGRHIWDVFPDAIGSKTYHCINDAFSKQEYVSNEDYYPALNLWQENHIYPSPGGVSIFIRDISEKKAKEQQIADQHDRITHAAEMQAAILDALPPHIALLNEHGEVLTVNRSWRKFAEATGGEMDKHGIGFNYLLVCEKITGASQTDSSNIASGIKGVLDGSSNEFITEYACGAPQHQKWFQLIVAPLRDKKHKGAVVLHIDITQRKLAEESLASSRANLKSVFENTDQCIILFDSKLNIVDFNQNAAELGKEYFGNYLERGRSGFEYFPPERQEAVIQQVQLAREGEAVSYEVFYQFDNKPGQWYEVKWVAIPNEDQRLSGMIMTFKNITQRKEHEDEIQRQNKILRRIAWISSHEVRRPVASIKGLLYLLNLSTELDDKEELMRLVGTCANELDDMVHNIHEHINNDVELGY